jgi:hypothetical protein
MPEMRALDRELAKQSPEIVFAHPSALRDEILLTYGEKLATLERWRLNILHALSAASEGMATQGVSGPLLKLLEEIEEAKEALRAQHTSIGAN